MSKFWSKGSISNKDFVIHMLKNLLECHIILDELENHLTLSGTHALNIEVIHEKLNHQYEKLRMKVKKSKKREGMNSLWETLQG